MDKTESEEKIIDNSAESAGSRMLKQESSVLMKGATILAVAGIISKIFGAIFRIPLTNMIGANGQSYYTVAYNIYQLLFVASTAGFPVAISRMVSSRIAKKDYINAHKSYVMALRLSTGLGIVCFAFLFFGAGFIARAYNIPASEASIRALSLALLITPVVASFRGYYQGRQIMTPTAVSEVVEQMVRVAVGLSLAYLFYKTSLEYAAAGATFGASAGITVALVVMLVIYVRDKSRREEMLAESVEQHENEKERFKELISYLIPVTLSVAMLPIMFNIDSVIVVRKLMASGWDRNTSEALFGLMGGYCDPIVNLPNIFIDAICISMMPAITRAFTLKNKPALDNHVKTGLKTMMIIAYPCTIGLIVLAKPILTMLFYKQYDEAVLAVPTLRILSLLIVTGAIMRTFATSLQGIGHMMIPVQNLLIGVIVKALVSYNLIGIHAININGAPTGSVLAYITAGILNYKALKKFTDVTIDVKAVFGGPLIASLIMGAAAGISYKLAFMLLSSNSISCMISMIVAVVVYIAASFKTGAVTRDEIELIPKGDILYKLAEKLKLVDLSNSE